VSEVKRSRVLWALVMAAGVWAASGVAAAPVEPVVLGVPTATCSGCGCRGSASPRPRP